MHLLAHQGGWDEILMVLAPIVVIAALVRVVQRRTERANEAAADAAPGPDPLVAAGDAEPADRSTPG